jgi:predicted ATPase
MNTTLSSGPFRQPRYPPLMVGRERERQALDEHQSEMEAGNGRLILIGGEAGIGKTTLVESFAIQARARGALVVSGHCYDLATTPPLGPWVELIGNFPDGDDLSGPQPEPVFDTDGSGVSSQVELFQRVLGLLAAASTTRLLVLLLEDIHWSDDASLDLLLHIARNSRNARILLIATYRDDELTHRHPLFQMLPRLVREARAERLHLNRLNSSHLEQLVATRYTLEHAEQTAIVELLVRMSDGNPLYATELLRSLEEEQRLLRDGESWRVTNLDQIQVPLLIRQVIETRLARLDDSTQRLLEIAAVIGQAFSLDLWRLVADIDDIALADAIDQSIGAGLIAETAAASLRFTHALIRETIHERLSLLRRRPWHQRVAMALIDAARPDPDAVVYHLEQAGDARLVDWLIRSGDRAQQRFSWPVAAERLDRAQALLSEDPARATERGWLLFRIGVMTRNADRAASLTHLEDAERIAAAEEDRVLQHLAGAHKGLVLCYGKDVRQGLIDL